MWYVTWLALPIEERPISFSISIRGRQIVFGYNTPYNTPSLGHIVAPKTDVLLPEEGFDGELPPLRNNSILSMIPSTLQRH